MSDNEDIVADDHWRHWRGAFKNQQGGRQQQKIVGGGGQENDGDGHPEAVRVGQCDD